MAEHQAPPERSRSVAELITETTEQTRRLVRDEIRLAALEMQSKRKRFTVGAGLAGAGSLLAFYGGAILAATLVIALALTLWWWVSGLIVGLALVAIGGILTLAGKKNVEKAIPPLPQEAASGVQHDIAAIKDGSTR
ncbi:phage holin family protein [Nocardia sp. NPDC050406]|uniref:phage holin family protein n=1 Tax=Nocardia sp. NPDC050406 TaxID=3364318 RepID=UPI0037A10367